MLKGKIAFLVIAHTDPEMLARLTRRLLPYGRVFVHVDGKRPLAPFEAAVPREATFLRNRVRISWGGFSMVQATLDLMRSALESMPEAERFVLLSGLDYPTVPLDEFTAMLEARPEHNFVRGFDILGSPTDRNKLLNARFMDDLLPFAASGGLGRSIAFVNRLVRKIDRETAKGRERSFPFEMRPVDGSQWWVLTRPMVEHVLDFVRANPAFVRYYRRTFVPDEQFIQTIALNSPLAEHADPIEPYTGQQIADVANVHLIHASLGKTYRLEDLDEVRGSGKWFVRKVTTSESGPLLDRLDLLAGVEAATP